MKHRILICLVCLLQYSACVALSSAMNTEGVIEALAESPGDRVALSKLKAVVAGTADADQKARLATIYCLGCLYTGQKKEASQVYAYLSKTYPSHSALASLSRDVLSDPCPTCNGVGSTPSACPKCHGTGTCTVCQGRGYWSIQTFGGKKNQRCASCSGTGKCRECAGTGNKSRRCTKCGGTGSVYSRAKIEQSYVELLRATQGLSATQIALTSVTEDSLTSQPADTLRSPTPRQEGPQQMSVWTIASGLGVDEESAKLQALRAAVQQVVGVYLDAETVIANSEVIDDQILDYSAGFVNDYEITQTARRADLLEVTLKAKVERSKLHGRIRDVISVEKHVDGGKLFSLAASELETQQKRRELLRTVAADFPQKAVGLDIASIKIVRPLDDGSVNLDITITFTLLPEFTSRLQNALAATALKTGVLNEIKRLIPSPERPEKVKETGALIRGVDRRLMFYELDAASYWSIVNGVMTGEDWMISSRDRVERSDNMIFLYPVRSSWDWGLGHTPLLLAQRFPRLRLELLGDGGRVLGAEELYDFTCDSNPTTGCPQYWEFAGGLFNFIYHVPYDESERRDLSDRYGEQHESVSVYDTPSPDTELEQQLLLRIFPGKKASCVYRINVKSDILEKVVRCRANYICPLKKQDVFNF